jgi:hypothetical protein
MSGILVGANTVNLAPKSMLQGLSVDQQYSLTIQATTLRYHKRFLENGSFLVRAGYFKPFGTFYDI